ncbi:MAG: ATPase, T2SS/T4P/T4SS family [Bacteroidota bacterium]
MTFEQLVADQQDFSSPKGKTSKYAPPSDFSPQKALYKQKLEQAPEIPAMCDKIYDSIPRNLQGIERIRFTAKQVQAVPVDERGQLQDVVEHFMRYMIHAGASDIDAGGFASGGSVWSRIDGEKKPRLELGRYTIDETNILILSLLTNDEIEKLLVKCAVDISYQVMGGVDMGTWHRYRVSIYFDNDGVAINIRAIANELRSIDGLGFHPTIKNGLMFDHVRDGLTLITGVTGSGKSTTLDSIVDANNSRVAGHIVIIGNPIEYIHMSKQCIVRHREVGKDVMCFHDGVVQALRQDPDIIVIGEMRDPKTISAALEVTDSGHKVFSTLHTSSAVESVARIVAEYTPEEQERVRNRLADVLRCIVSQKLLPRKGGGRILAKEVLWVTPSVRAAIKNNNLEEIYQMMWEGRAQGQHTLEQDLFRLVKQQKIERNVAIDYSNNKKRLQQLMGVY